MWERPPHSAHSSRVPPPGSPDGSLPLFFAMSSKHGATAPLPPIEGNMVALRTLHKIPHFEIILGPGKPHAMSAAGTRNMPRLKRGRQEEIVPPRDPSLGERIEMSAGRVRTDGLEPPEVPPDLVAEGSMIL